jgi:hypothetical protein
VVDNRLIILIIKIKGINCHYLWLLPKMKLTRRVLRIVKIFYYTCRSRTGNGDYLIHTQFCSMFSTNILITTTRSFYTTFDISCNTTSDTYLLDKEYLSGVVSRRWKLYQRKENQQHSKRGYYFLSAILLLIRLITEFLQKVQLKKKRVYEKVTVQ